MFTGIIEALGTIRSISKSGQKNIVKLNRPASFTELYESASIACNGICLTVISFDQDSLSVEVMNETLSKTNARLWKQGDILNLERALRMGARLDGHWVQGHVDRTLALSSVKKKNSTQYLSFAFPHEDKSLLVPQGSITLNGVSLTLAELNNSVFTVALIGHTLQYTNLDKLSIGQHVNVEYDVLGKYILQLISKSESKISEKWLYEQGF